MIKTARRGLLLLVVVLLALGAVQALGDGEDGGPPDIGENERLVQIRYFTSGGSREQPIRFDLDGGFKGGTEFRENDKRSGHLKTGTTVVGTITWSKMYVHANSPIPTRMWCEVWQGKVEITHTSNVYPKLTVAYCAGSVK